MESFNLRVKTLAPATHEVSVAPSTTVAALKAVVAPLAGCPAHRQRLIFRGRVINDGQTLQELGARGCSARGAHGCGACPGALRRAGAAPPRPRPRLPRPRPQASAPMTRSTWWR